MLHINRATIARTLATTTTTVGYFAMTFAAYAQTSLDPCVGPGGSGDFRTQLCSINSSQSGAFMRNLVIAAFVIAGIIALFFLIWGGIKWILSGGDKTKVEAARSTIIAALIGLIITFLAYFLLSMILGLFGLGLDDLTIPQLSATTP